MKIVQVTMYEDEEGVRHENRRDAIRADLIIMMNELGIPNPWDILDNADKIYILLEEWKAAGGFR